MTPRVQSWIQEVRNGEINYLELGTIHKGRLLKGVGRGGHQEEIY